MLYQKRFSGNPVGIDLLENIGLGVQFNQRHSPRFLMNSKKKNTKTYKLIQTKQKEASTRSTKPCSLIGGHF